MIKFVSSILAALFLAGCSSTPEEPKVVTKYEYVVRTAVAQQKALPPYPAPITASTATQTELAEWMLQTEKRMYDLESIIKNLIDFYEAPVTEAAKKAK